jgi:hypothetical protein
MAATNPPPHAGVDARGGAEDGWGLMRPSCWAARTSDDAFLLQRVDLAGTEAEPRAEHLGIVLAQQR